MDRHVERQPSGIPREPRSPGTGWRGAALLAAASVAVAADPAAAGPSYDPSPAVALPAPAAGERDGRYAVAMPAYVVGADGSAHDRPRARPMRLELPPAEARLAAARLDGGAVLDVDAVPDRPSWAALPLTASIGGSGLVDPLGVGFGGEASADERQAVPLPAGVWSGIVGLLAVAALHARSRRARRRTA